MKKMENSRQVDRQVPSSPPQEYSTHTRTHTYRKTERNVKRNLFELIRWWVYSLCEGSVLLSLTESLNQCGEERCHLSCLPDREKLLATIWPVSRRSDMSVDAACVVARVAHVWSLERNGLGGHTHLSGGTFIPGTYVTVIATCPSKSPSSRLGPGAANGPRKTAPTSSLKISQVRFFFKRLPFFLSFFFFWSLICLTFFLKTKKF